jgi:ribosome maturation factor RimP
MAVDKAAVQEALKAKLQEILEPVVRSEGLILVELQYRAEGSGLVLRLYVDRPQGGVTLEECAQVSRQAGDLLDVEDVISGRFHLEVSSPGLTRRLRTPRDFEVFAGRAVKVMYLDQEGKSRTLRGRLKGLQGREVVIEAEGRMRALALERLTKANLDPGL